MNAPTLLLLAFMSIAIVGTALAAVHDFIEERLRPRSPTPAPPRRQPHAVTYHRTPRTHAPLLVRERRSATLRA